MTRAPAPARTSWRPVRPVRGDLVAGVTVTAYLVPQVMAYADLAGVPPAAGLWAAVGAMTVYAVIGTSPRLSVGPEATTALMTAAALGTAGAAGAARPRGGAGASWWRWSASPGRLLGLARLAELLSRPVLVGYMTGIALVMMITQLAKLTGAPIPDGKSPLAELGWFLRHLDTVEGATLAVGLVTLVGDAARVVALAAGAGRPARHGRGQRGRRRARAGGPRGRLDRPHPVRAPPAGAARRRARRARRPGPRRPGGGVRGVLRQHPDRARVRHPQGRPDRRAP